MKNLFLALSLLLSISILFNACTKREQAEIIEQEIVEQPEQSQIDDRILLPSYLHDASLETIRTFIDNLSEDEQKLRKESYKIFTFLEYTDNLQDFLAENPTYNILTYADLEKYATRDLNKYDDFSPDSDREPCEFFRAYCSGTTRIIIEKCCDENNVCHLVSYPPYYNHPYCVVPPSCQSPPCFSPCTCVNGSCLCPPQGQLEEQ